MKKWPQVISILISITTLNISNAHATAQQEIDNFHDIFNKWTLAFNQKKHPEVCDLFSKNIKADYQGSPKKTFAMMCDGFKKIFQEKELRYQNHFKIHEIYHSGDLAAVRITWYLDAYKNGTHISTTQEEGLDVFQKQPDGRWQIVNFIAYPILADKNQD